MIAEPYDMCKPRYLHLPVPPPQTSAGGNGQAQHAGPASTKRPAQEGNLFASWKEQELPLYKAILEAELEEDKRETISQAA